MRKRPDINLFAVPWEVLEYDESPDACDSLVICAEAEDLATVYSSNEATVHISRKDAIRAAHLMAAAPDLYDALMSLTGAALAGDDLRVVIERAQRVLDRAGRGYPSAIMCLSGRKIQNLSKTGLYLTNKASYARFIG